MVEKTDDKNQITPKIVVTLIIVSLAIFYLFYSHRNSCYISNIFCDMVSKQITEKSGRFGKKII
jgi:hypothetical protein